MTVFEDNQSCISDKQLTLATERGKNTSTFALITCANKYTSPANATMEYVSTEKQIADALSKNLPNPAFERHRASMGLELKAHAPPASSKHVSWNTKLSTTR
jgi:hypothetical protein